ncbi:MAG: hypothetical protein RJA57_1091 [Bacteroidota bacterium]|jgi:cell division protein FtsB
MAIPADTVDTLTMDPNQEQHSNPRPLLTRGLGKLPRWVKNKYLLSFTVFTAILLFLDKNDLFTQVDRTRELRDLRKSKAFYSSQIEAERKESEALKHQPATLEKYAREKYLMKRDNEELFLVPEDPKPQKN